MALRRQEVRGQVDAETQLERLEATLTLVTDAALDALNREKDLETEYAEPDSEVAEEGEGEGPPAAGEAVAGFGKSCSCNEGLGSTLETLRDSSLLTLLLLVVPAPLPSLLFSKERSSAPARRMVAFAPSKREPSIAQQ